jgi:hypothetical protein
MVWLTIVSKMRRVRTMVRPSTDRASHPGLAPARQAGEDGDGEGPGDQGPSDGREQDCGAGADEHSGAGGQRDTRAGQEIGASGPESGPEGRGQHEQRGDQNEEKTELQEQAREVEVPAQEREVGVENDPPGELVQGQARSGAEPGGGDEGGRSAEGERPLPELAGGPEHDVGQTGRQADDRQRGEEDVGRRLRQSSPRDESGHRGLEQAQGLDPL